jgi:DeoR family transcriptional regulator, fructose operon transcriptional repressor
MSFQLRKAKILTVLDERGTIDVHALATLLHLSDMTIRRDLNTLAEQGLLLRTHGGAMLPDSDNRPVSFAGKSGQQTENKAYIAQLAAREIADGDTIFMDCGSTVFALCPFIRHKPITVITNSLPIVAELITSTVTLNLIGGELDKTRQAVHGLTAESHIARYRANKAFIGVDGVSVANGLSANGELEAAHTLALMRQSAQIYLLCDSTKLEQDRYLTVAPLSAINVLITDRGAEPILLKRYEEAGVRIVREG